VFAQIGVVATGVGAIAGAPFGMAPAPYAANQPGCRAFQTSTGVAPRFAARKPRQARSPAEAVAFVSAASLFRPQRDRRGG